MTQLSDALNAANRENLSYREIWRRADKHGSTISLSTVAAYMGGKHSENANLNVLKTFASVFGVSLNELLRAAQMSELNEAFVLPESAAALDRRERQVVLDMVDILVRSKKPQTEEAPHPERNDYDLAAYEGDGPSPWKHRRDEDASRGEESQENPHDDI